MRKTTQRKYDILRAYLVATGGRPPEDLGELLRAMREIIGDVSEAEVLASIKWALRHRAELLPFRRLILGNAKLF